MSRRRRYEDDDGALDLFLDAISNVFGGILFIALAVVVLLQMTVPKPDHPTSDASDDQATAPAPTNAAASLLDTIQAQSSDAQPFLSEQRDAALKKRSRLRDRLDESTAALAESQRAAQDAEAPAAAAEARLAELEAELLDAQRTLSELRNRPTQRVRAARFRPTAKREVPVMIAAGGVVFPLGNDGVPVPARLVIDDQNQNARPNLEAGTPIPAQAAAADATLTRLLAPLDPRRDYLNLAVWPDGFDAARRLRDTAIDLGFEFTLTPIAADAGVPFNAAAGVQ